MNELATPVLRRAAMHFLARREHSQHELKHKLLLKFSQINEVSLNEALVQLKAENLQSDSRFAESYTRFRKNKGFGYLHIKRELELRRVHPDIISEYLNPDHIDWISIATSLLKKKIRRTKVVIIKQKEYSKLVWYLQNRGFIHNQIDLAMKSLVDSDYVT
jgi:regulatory protein